MIEAQLVTGATQDMRILTGSALCAALAPKSAEAATLANINLDRRMRSSWWRVWRRSADFDATLQSASALGKGRNWHTLGERSGNGFRRAPLWRGLLQHPSLGFNRIEAGDHGCDGRDGRERGEDRWQAAREHHSDHRRADH